MSKEIDFKNRDRFIQLGITISVLRKMRGMSQEQLAAEAMMSRSHLSAIEAPNIVRPFSVEVLFNIADALKVEPGDLLNTSIIPDQILNKKRKIGGYGTIKPIATYFNISAPRIRGFRSDLRCTGLPDSYHRSFPQRYKQYRFRLFGQYRCGRIVRPADPTNPCYPNQRK